MMQNNRNNGLTLIELMVTIVAASILVLNVGLVLIMGYRSWRTSNTYVSLRRDSSLAFYMMAKDVRETEYAKLTAGNPLTLPSAISAKTVTYTQNANTLLYDDGTGPFLLIPENVQLFDSVKQDGGVLLTLALAEAGLDITMTNEVFVNTRN